MSGYRTLHRETTSSPVLSVRFGLDDALKDRATDLNMVSCSMSGSVKIWKIYPKRIQDADDSASALCMINSARIDSAHGGLAVCSIDSATNTADNSDEFTLRTLISSGIDGTIKYWSYSSSSSKYDNVATIDSATTQRSISSEVSPDKKLIAATAKDCVNVFSTSPDNTSVIFSLPLPSSTSPMSLAWSSDSTSLAVGCTNSTVQVFSTSTTTKELKYTTETSNSAITFPIRSIQFTSDNALLLAGCDDKSIYAFDNFNKGALVSIFTGHVGWINSITANSDNRRFASASSDGKVKVWDLGTKECVHTFDGHTGEVAGVCFTGGGKRMVSGGADGIIIIFSTDI